jgi:hypothetical protein
MAARAEVERLKACTAGTNHQQEGGSKPKRKRSSGLELLNGGGCKSAAADKARSRHLIGLPEARLTSIGDVAAAL